MTTAGFPTGSIPFGGGAVLTNVEINAVYVGNQWQVAPMAAVRQQFDAFLQFFVVSAAMAELSEYHDAQGAPIGLGAPPSTGLISIQLPAQITDSDIRGYLYSAITNRITPAPNQNSLYAAIIPDGVAVTAPGVGSSCTGHCGYHSDNGGQYPYAVLCFLTCPECCPPPLTPFQGFTASGSHEIREAVTNPFGNGWINGDTELGDACNTPQWHCYDLNGYMIQRIWSNKRGVCV